MQVLLVFMSFAVPTVSERPNDWLDKPFDFHISILELLLQNYCQNTFLLPEKLMRFVLHHFHQNNFTSEIRGISF